MSSSSFCRSSGGATSPLKCFSSSDMAFKGFPPPLAGIGGRTGEVGREEGELSPLTLGDLPGELLLLLGELTDLCDGVFGEGKASPALRSSIFPTPGPFPQTLGALLLLSPSVRMRLPQGGRWLLTGDWGCWEEYRWSESTGLRSLTHFASTLLAAAGDFNMAADRDFSLVSG